MSIYDEARHTKTMQYRPDDPNYEVGRSLRISKYYGEPVDVTGVILSHTKFYTEVATDDGDWILTHDSSGYMAEPVKTPIITSPMVLSVGETSYQQEKYVIMKDDRFYSPSVKGGWTDDFSKAVRYTLRSVQPVARKCGGQWKKVIITVKLED